VSPCLVVPLAAINSTCREQAVSDVLRGVVVYFEGYTDDVTSFQLKKLVYSHGGDIWYAAWSFDTTRTHTHTHTTRHNTHHKRASNA
jgi:hypothetical protein